MRIYTHNHHLLAKRRCVIRRLVHSWRTPGALLWYSWCTPGAILVHSWCHPGALLVPWREDNKISCFQHRNGPVPASNRILTLWHLECTRNAPRVHQERTKSPPGVLQDHTRSAPGLHQECTRSARMHFHQGSVFRILT